jgi:hypothetical protein
LHVRAKTVLVVAVVFAVEADAGPAVTVTATAVSEGAIIRSPENVIVLSQMGGANHLAQFISAYE